MKRLAASIPAAVALAAGVCCIPAVSASASDVTLTPAQTRALFGDVLYSQYYDGTDYHEAYFTYFDSAVITQVSSASYGSGVYNPTGKYCLVYALDSVTSDSLQNVGTSYWSCDVRPVFDIQGLNRYTISCGYSFDLGKNGLWDFWPSLGMSFSNDNANSAAITASKYIVYSDYRTTDTDPVAVTNYLPYYNDAGWLYGRCAKITMDSHSDQVYFSCYSCDIQNYNKYFTVFGNYTSENGLIQYGRVEKPSGTFVDPDISARIFFYIECPVLTSGYVHSNPPTWDSGGGSESSGGGYDGPDYTDQLALILAKLDLIVNNDFNIDVDLSADLAGLESRLDGVNSRLDGVNSRLDGNNSRVDGANSRLDGVNSRLDGVNSRLDHISGELHDLNSAPTGTLPNTGGENSEFERQADMYMSDFRNEFEDSENQVFEVIDKGMGFLGFVREILVTSHLAQILPLLALLFIAHYVIFERGG